MDKGKRYDVSGLLEAQFEPGSRGQVLKNLLGIKSKREMERVEARALEELEDFLLRNVDKTFRFTAETVCSMHKTWLGKIYPWAGRYRQVNLSKGNFPFASAGQISSLMKSFDQDVLSKYTPCTFKSFGQIVTALATVHTELILIHPFREGNGRLARLLATLMGLQAAGTKMNFRLIEKGRKKMEYFAAVQAGLDKNYRPMEKIFSEMAPTEKKLAQ